MQNDVLDAESLDHVHDRTQIAEPRPFIGGRDIFDVEAIARDADAGNDEHTLGLVEMLVDGALDEAAVADHGNNLLILDQLGRDLGRLLRFPGIVLDRINDRPAVDAAILVDAFEIGVGGLRRRTEIGRSGLADHGAELDRLAGRGLAVVHAAFRRIRRRGRQCRQTRRESGDSQGQRYRSDPLHRSSSLFFCVTRLFCVTRHLCARRRIAREPCGQSTRPTSCRGP